MLASGRCAGLKGKTPEATISAMLAVGSKRSGPFTRVDKGTYTLADSSAKPAQAKAKLTATAKRTAAPKSASGTKSTTAKRTPVKRSR